MPILLRPAQWFFKPPASEGNPLHAHLELGVAEVVPCQSMANTYRGCRVPVAVDMPVSRSGKHLHSILPKR